MMSHKLKEQRKNKIGLTVKKACMKLDMSINPFLTLNLYKRFNMIMINMFEGETSHIVLFFVISVLCT